MSIVWEVVNIYNYILKYIMLNFIYYLNKSYLFVIIYVKWIYYIWFVYVVNICVKYLYLNIYNLYMCNMKIIYICFVYNWLVNKIEFVLIIIMCMIIWKYNFVEYFEFLGDFCFG